MADETVHATRASVPAAAAGAEPVSGTLTLTRDTVIWQPDDPAAAPARQLEIARITGHQRSKAGGAKPSARLVSSAAAGGDASGGSGAAAPSTPPPLVLQFAAERERDAFSDALAPLLARARVAAAPGGSSAALDAHAAVARAALLATNADVAALHAQLVGGGVLSEPDFWAAQAPLLADATSRRGLGQRPGLANALMGEVRAAQDGRSKKVNFTLSKEQIAQVFAEHPSVRAAYLAHVPAKMSDLEFWTKYCRVVYFRAARKGGAPETEAEAADAALFAPDEAAMAAEAAARVGGVDPRVNLAAAADDDALDRAGRGVAHGGPRERADGGGTSSTVAAVIRDINRHAAVVLDGVPDALPEDRAALAAAAAARSAAERAAAAQRRSGGAAGAKAGGAAEEELMEDLRAVAPAQLQELRIQDPRRYFDAAAAAGGAGAVAVPGKAAKGTQPPPLAQQAAGLADVAVASADALPAPLALRVLTDMGHANATASVAGAWPGGGGGGGGGDAAVPAALTAEFRDKARAARELLRHFWGAVSSGSGTAAARAAKRTRVRDALAAIYDKLAASKDALPSAGRHAASQQLRPLLAALDAAFEAADAEQPPAAHLPPPAPVSRKRAAPEPPSAQDGVVVLD